MAKDKRGYLQISFGWLFAIVVGAVILFFAIFGSVKLIRMGQSETGSETQKEIEILLNPLETGFETGRISSFKVTRDTRIHNTCNKVGTFGSQRISLSQESFGKWSEETQGISFKNKYIFSEDVLEGKEFLIFSKPFEFPFKVSDLIYLISKKDVYCFVDAREEVEEELSRFNATTFVLKEDLEECGEKDIKVCFDDNDDCDIVVDYPERYVKKGGNKIYFDDYALMYGAIFSDKAIYECQLQRLLNKAEQLNEIYLDKITLISEKGCESDLNDDLVQFGSLINDFENSEDLLDLGIANRAEDILEKNDDETCKLW